MDILTEILKRDSAKKPQVFSMRSAWMVCVGSANNRRTRNLYTYAAAKRLAARFNRIFKTDEAYATAFGKVTLVSTERLRGDK